MRKLILVAILAVPVGCAHHEPRNLAQRQSVTTPRGDFQRPRRDGRRDDGLRQVEPPVATPPIP